MSGSGVLMKNFESLQDEGLRKSNKCEQRGGEGPNFVHVVIVS